MKYCLAADSSFSAYGDEAFIIAGDGCYVSLNESAALIVKSAIDKFSMEEIADMVHKKYGINYADALFDVIEVLAGLERQGILTAVAKNEQSPC